MKIPPQTITMNKEIAKWKPINLKSFNRATKKLRKKIGLKRLKEIDKNLCQKK